MSDYKIRTYLGFDAFDYLMEAHPSNKYVLQFLEQIKKHEHNWRMARIPATQKFGVSVVGERPEQNQILYGDTGLAVFSKTKIIFQQKRKQKEFPVKGGIVGVFGTESVCDTLHGLIIDPSEKKANVESIMPAQGRVPPLGFYFTYDGEIWEVASLGANPLNIQFRDGNVHL